MSGDMSEELKNLVERYKKAPESRLFAPLADAYRKNGEIDEAIELCEKGLERFPDYVSARVILGKCFYDKGATERARDEFNRVLKADPDNMVARKYMGEILLAENKKEEAAEHFRHLLSIDPTNVEASKTLEEIESQFQVKEIDLSDKKHVRDERPGELATMTLAGIYAAQGYYNKALKIYRDILQKEPENVEVQGMVDKLQTLLDSSEKERGEAFDQEGLAISIDEAVDQSMEMPEEMEVEPSPEPAAAEDADLSEERGFILVDKEGDKPTEPGVKVEEKPIEEEKPVGEAAGAEEKKKASKKREKKKVKEEEKEETAEGNIENFQSWLRKLKGD
jgi:tetratricopeptide (TPR) repeat protein